jgi:hypothetical protein
MTIDRLATDPAFDPAIDPATDPADPAEGKD